KLTTTNMEKSQILAKTFFLVKPTDAGIPENYAYSKVCYKADQIMKEQIMHQLTKLRPYKAPGPDSIPNIVLSKCTDLLIDRLYYIYKAIMDKGLQYMPWKNFTTVVLPCDTHYDIPKAYQPIALLCTMWKVLTAIVVDQITFYSEKYQLLPAHHF
ncbi:hypothetical protein BJV74DRAFT_749504, partial [Russula compacta]